MYETMKRGALALGLLSALSACGGGDGSSEATPEDNDNTLTLIEPEDQTPSNQRVVYYRYDSSLTQYLLYAGYSHGGDAILLSPMSNANGDVRGQYRLSPNQEWVAYFADADVDGALELYASKVDGSVLSRKLSGPLPGHSRTPDNIVWSPDSAQVAYVADQNYQNTWELFVSSLNGDVGVRVSGDLPAGREGNTDVIRRDDTSNSVASQTDDVVQWSPDGSRIAYIGDYESNQLFELYTVKPDGSDIQRISGSMVNSADSTNGMPWKDRRQSFAWSADSTRIAFRADKETNHQYELYLADAASTTEPDKLSQTPLSGEDVYFFDWAPDGSRIAYSFYNANTADYELYSVSPQANPNRIKLSNEPGHLATVNVPYFAWSPDSSRIAYVSNSQSNPTYDLFVAQPDSAASSQRVSGMTNLQGLRADGSVAFYWSPDSAYLAYLSYQLISNVQELFVSSYSGNSNVKLSGSLGSSNNISRYLWSPNSQTLAYVSNQGADSNTYKLYASPLAGADLNGPASNPRLNPDLITDGDVSADGMRWTNDSTRVLYYADQDIDGEEEFYSSTIDGYAENIKVSTAVAAPVLSFANDVFTQMSGCNACHSGDAWYSNGNAGATWSGMNAEGLFNNASADYIVSKLNGTFSHAGGTDTALANDFDQWISEGANNN